MLPHRPRPGRSASQEELSGAAAITQAAVRAAAIEFVRAYAATARSGRELARPLVAGPVLRDWVHWVAVQQAELQGSTASHADVGAVGPARPVDLPGLGAGGELVREVDLVAGIDLRVSPDEGDPFSYFRALDGPMRLVSDEAGRWRVTDFTRDGLPLSAVFQVLEDVGIEDGSGVAVAVDSFVALPTWQFDLRVSAEDGPAISLTSAGATIVDRSGRSIAVARDVTSSLSTIGAGETVEGIVTFGALPTADGVLLRLRFTRTGGTGARRRVLELPLARAIRPIAIAQASPPPAPV